MLVIHHVIWNERNIAHIARHSVTLEEVEAVCFGVFAVLESYQQRYVVVGKTRTGRLLSVIISLQSENTYYVITARSADPKERKYHRQTFEKGGENAA